MRRVGFIGIGNMGWPMAANLVAAGFDVTVADVVDGRAQAFAEQVGGHAAGSAPQAAAGVDVLVTILPTSAHVASVVAEVRRVLSSGAVFIEMSSGVPAITRELAEKLRAPEVALVDCPVSGGVAKARSGELSIMAGGDDAALDRVSPVLEAMGSTIHRCGQVGAGQAMKALNNLVSAGGFLIGVEALLIGRQFGLDPTLMVDVLNSSTGMNNSTLKKFKQFVLSGTYDSGFGLDLMVKDLRIALDMSQGGQAGSPLAAACVELWSRAAELLGPGQDHTAVARFSESVSGVRLNHDEFD